MPQIIDDRVLESSTTTGAGDFTLAGAVTGFRRFSAVCSVGDTVSYVIEAIDSLGQPTGDYEYGTGTYSAANTLTRTTVTGSSNAGAAVNFAAGSKNVALVTLAADLERAQANSDNSNKLATSAWVRSAMSTLATAAGFASSLAANGYVKFPSWFGGLIIQWGTSTSSAAGAQTVALPLAFPASHVATVITPSLGGTAVHATREGSSLSDFSFSNWNTAGARVAVASTWVAVGW